MKIKLSKKSGNARRKIAKTLPTKISKILATSDLSDGSRFGVRYAVALAEKFSAAVALLHVIEPRAWVSELGSVAPPPRPTG